MRKTISNLPYIAGAEVVRFSVISFTRQGWLGNTFEAWPRRKVEQKGKGRAILVKSGRLRRSIRVLRYTSDYVIIGTDVPYARVHNEGFHGRVSVRGHYRNRYTKTRVGTGKYTKTGKERQRTVTSVSGQSRVKEHTRYMKIPRRRFLGDSPYMRRDIKRIIAAQIMKAAKSI